MQNPERSVRAVLGMSLFSTKRPGFDKSSMLLLPIFLFFSIFFVAPFIVIFLLSVSKEGIVGWTLDNYGRAIFNIYYSEILVKTVFLGVIVTVLTLILGFPCAYFAARAKGFLKSFSLVMVISPLLVSVIIRSYGWMIILGRNGLINKSLIWLGLIDNPLKLMYNWTGIVIGLTQVLLPFMILSIYSVIENININLEEVAETLGASRFQVFRTVIFPLSMDGIASGCIIVFMLTLGNFVTVLLLGGNTIVIPILIYQQVLNIMNFNFASAIGMILLGTSLIFLYFQIKLLKRKETRYVA